jgi:hypothetical protein
MDLANDGFRLRFDSKTWNERIDKPQAITAGGTLSNAAGATALNRSREMCIWQPDTMSSIPDDEMQYSLNFRKEGSSTVATFDLETRSGVHRGRLECYFPQTQTPDVITVGRRGAIVGSIIALEMR